MFYSGWGTSGFKLYITNPEFQYSTKINLKIQKYHQPGETTYSMFIFNILRSACKLIGALKDTQLLRMSIQGNVFQKIELGGQTVTKGTQGLCKKETGCVF